MAETITSSLMSPFWVRASWVLTRTQVVLSMVLAVMVSLCVSSLGWGDSGHVVKTDMYPLLAFGYASLIYAIAVVLFDRLSRRLSWRMFRYGVATSTGFFVADAFVGAGLAVSCAWIASGVVRAPGPGTEHYAAHTTCGPYQQYLDDLIGKGYSYDEYMQLTMEAGGLQGSCMGEMTAYCVGFIFSLSHLVMVVVRFRLRRRVKVRAWTLMSLPSGPGPTVHNVETDSTAKTVGGEEDKM